MFWELMNFVVPLYALYFAMAIMYRLSRAVFFLEGPRLTEVIICAVGVLIIVNGILTLPPIVLRIFYSIGGAIILIATYDAYVRAKKKKMLLDSMKRGP